MTHQLFMSHSCINKTGQRGGLGSANVMQKAGQKVVSRVAVNPKELSVGEHGSQNANITIKPEGLVDYSVTRSTS